MSTALMDRKLVVVTGKGGVGRTTISASLAVAMAQHGKRTCVVELSGMGAVPPRFGLEGRSFSFRRAAEGVDVWSLTVAECLQDFGRRKLGLNRLAGRLFRSRITRSFVDAVPGLHDLLQLGKLENLISEPLPSDPIYDVMILDAPATGHGLTLLSAARSMSEVTRVGPFHELARIIEEFLSDPARTAVVVVSLPEELPVHESLELARSLAADGLGPAAVIANHEEPPVLSGGLPVDGVREVLETVPGGELLDGLLVQSLTRQERQRSALSHLARELDDLGAPPLLHAPRVPEGDVHVLGAHLAEQL